ADVAHRFGRDAELALEGVDLGAFDRGVAFGELGGEHHHADGEELLALAEQGGHPRGAETQLAQPHIGHDAAVRGMAEGGAKHRAERAAHRKAGHAADDLAPVAHGCRSIISVYHVEVYGGKTPEPFAAPSDVVTHGPGG